MTSAVERSDKLYLSSEQASKLALWEVVSVVSSCLIAEWVVLSFAGRSKVILAVPVFLAISLMVFSHRERGESLRDIGFRTDNFFAACRWLLIPTLATLAVIIACGWFTHQSVFAAPWRARFFSLPFWALFQQYTLNGFINRRVQLVLGKGSKSILLVALVFGLLHLPNPILALMTLIGGLIWAAAYQRHPNLFALAISHSIVSIVTALSLPGNFLNSLRVGFKYFG